MHVATSQEQSHATLGGIVDSKKGSFSNVVKGGMIKSKKPDVPLVLEGKEITNDLALKPYILCQVRSVRLIPKWFVLLKEEGFHDIQLWYLGGD